MSPPRPAPRPPSMDERAAIFRPSALERLSSPEDLGELMVVTRPRGWLILLAIALLVAAAGAWSVAGRIEVTVAAPGRLVRAADAPPRAVLRLPLAEAHRVAPGQAARLAVAGFPPARYGYLLGRVHSLGRPDVAPAEPETHAAGPFVLVDVDLVRAVGTPGVGTPAALVWTSGDRRAGELRAGLGLEATIVVRSEPPILAMLPWLRPTLE